MKALISLVAAYGVALLSPTVAQAQIQPSDKISGEIQTFAVDTGNPQAMLALHRAGWLEAAGQLLSTDEFSAAYTMIRRTWTADKIPSDKFALPDLRWLSALPGEVDARTAELLGGDIVTGGRILRPSPRLLYCIYVGVDVSELDVGTGRLKRSSR
jgi:hypothetical protein